MSTTFIASAPFNHPQYGEVLAPVAGIEGANFSNTNAARVLDRIGLRGSGDDFYGEADIDTFDGAVQALVPSLDEGDEDARRLMELHRLARVGRDAGATHITWA